jgi:putative nucleotidyltransferase with HDIG domain
MLFRRKTKTPGSLRNNASEVSSVVPRIQLPVDMLEIGMRVIELDRPWTEVPVIFQGFQIDNPEQIQLLRHYCDWVLIESGKKKIALLEARIERLSAECEKPLKEAHALSHELPKARETYARGQFFVDEVLEDIRQNRELDFQAARPLIRDCVKSIEANANAMFWMTRIKSQDAYTAEHCLRVAVYAITLGHFMGMSEDVLEVLGLCGLLHDIGKMKVDPAILHKPGALTAEEMAHMRQHAEMGYQLLESHYTLDPIVSDVTRHHHERIDGTGYPDKLKEWQISRFARLISIVDAFDAMTSDRCYRKGLATSEALRVLYRGRNEQFDASIAEAFIRMIGIYPPGTLLELTSGEIAVVVGTHPGKKLKPQVEILLDTDKHPTTPYVLNLSDTPVDPRGCVYAIKRALPDGAYGISLEGRIGEIVGPAGSNKNW